MSLVRYAQGLEPSTNLSYLYNGLWSEYSNPNKIDQLRATHVPYIIRRILTGTTTLMSYSTCDGGCSTNIRIMTRGSEAKALLDIKYDLVFDQPFQSDTMFFGLVMTSISTMRRTFGGNREDELVSCTRGNRSVRLSHMKLKLKGSTLYIEETFEYQFMSEEIRYWETLWKRDRLVDKSIEEAVYYSHLDLAQKELQDMDIIEVARV